MFKDDYQAAFSKVTASQETHRRILNMTKENKKRSLHGGWASKLLIAAVLVSLTVVTASASEYVRGWFTTFFSDNGETPLADGQIKYIEKNEQHIDESQTRNGWTIALRSAISDGMKGYIMLGVTAPEGVNLEEILEKSKQEYYGPRNEYLPKDPDAVLNCSAYPDVSVIANIGSSWIEDGDGLKNTLSYVINVSPDVEFADFDPFSSEALWHIHIVDLVHGFPEQELLAEGVWDFDFTFENDNTEIQLLTKPMKTMALALPGDGTEKDAQVTMTSVALRPFGITIYYGDPGDGLDYERTNVAFAKLVSGRSPWFAVMKDGSKMQLLYAGGNPVVRYSFLEAQSPIVLENVDYILLSDGAKLPMPELPNP